MKFNKSSQLVLVSAASLLAATLVTACSQFTETLTVDFVYVVSSKAAGTNNYGNIDVFEINSESGRMRTIPSSPFPSGGRNPVAAVVSADYGSLFVANQYDNTIAQFTIGTDGKLYPYTTVNTPGIYPVAMAATKSDLFVADTYEPLPTCSTATPCPGALGVFPLTAASNTAPATLGSPAVNASVNGTYWPLSLTGAQASDVVAPTAVAAVTPSGANGATYVFASAYDSTANTGYIFGFSVGSNGALTPLSGSPYAAGEHPSAIAADPTGTYVYVTDFSKAEVLGFSVAKSGASAGSLAPLTSGNGGSNAFAAGNQPVAIVFNPSYPFAYVANSLDSTVTAYSVSNGKLTAIAEYATGLQPVAMGIDPSTNRFLFTANFLGNNVSGFISSPADGTLLVSQDSPYAADAQPVAVAAIPHNGTGGGVQPQ
ncbi:MAG TPA: beta-propeller fold lactonase family protein [Terracidiphilus sp.]|nr:beta-propeller fold lactonase family protein [Terracidiphilus sp.]